MANTEGGILPTDRNGDLTSVGYVFQREAVKCNSPEMLGFVLFRPNGIVANDWPPSIVGALLISRTVRVVRFGERLSHPYLTRKSPSGAVVTSTFNLSAKIVPPS